MTRRTSEAMIVLSNPLESGILISERKIDNLVGTVPIQKFQLDAIIGMLKAIEYVLIHMISHLNIPSTTTKKNPNFAAPFSLHIFCAIRTNDSRLALLDDEKIPYLFKSAQLTELINLTPSIKTRLAMIVMIGPRLIDPRAKVDYFLELFRFSEEKEKVQEVLKARTQFLSANAYRQTSLSLTNNNAVDNTHAVPSNPFIGIKGLAQARERGVVKPKTIPRSRQSDPAVISMTPETLIGANSNIGKQNGRYSTPAILPRASSDPYFQGQGQSTVPLVPIKSTIDALNQSGSVDVAPVVAKRNSKKYSIPPLVLPLPSNPPSTPAVPLKVFTSFPSKSGDSPRLPTKSVGSPINKEFCSVGKVQRIIKLLSSNYVPLQDGEALFGADSAYRDENGNISPGNKCRTNNEYLTPLKGRRSQGDTLHGGYDSPSRMKRLSRNLSNSVVTEEDDMRGSSECTSVESSDAHDSDSVTTWRKNKAKRGGVKSLAGDINRLSFERKKGLFQFQDQYQSHELNYNSANDSAVTERESDGDVAERCQRRGTWLAKKRSGSVPSEEYIRRSHRTNSVTFQSIVDQFKVAVNSNNKGTGAGALTSLSKDFILYQNMPVEGPCDRASDGTPLFRYYELVRMNFVKQYDGIRQSELIFAMEDSDFLEHLGVNKVRDEKREKERDRER